MRQAVEHEPQDQLIGAGCWQMQPDLGLHLDQPSGDLDQAQTQGIELGDTPGQRFGIAIRSPHMSQ
jgi:hypothetical protein